MVILDYNTLPICYPKFFVGGGGGEQKGWDRN